MSDLDVPPLDAAASPSSPAREAASTRDDRPPQGMSLSVPKGAAEESLQAA